MGPTVTPDQYRAAIQRLGFASINEAGRWLGVGDVAGRRWATDGPPESVAKFLELMLAEDYTPADVDRAIRAWKARQEPR